MAGSQLSKLVSIIGQVGCFLASRKELIPPLPRASQVKGESRFPRLGKKLCNW